MNLVVYKYLFRFEGGLVHTPCFQCISRLDKINITRVSHIYNSNDDFPYSALSMIYSTIFFFFICIYIDLDEKNKLDVSIAVREREEFHIFQQ